MLRLIGGGRERAARWIGGGDVAVLANAAGQRGCYAHTLPTACAQSPCLHRPAPHGADDDEVACARRGVRRPRARDDVANIGRVDSDARRRQQRLDLHVPRHRARRGVEGHEGAAPRGEVDLAVGDGGCRRHVAVGGVGPLGGHVLDCLVGDDALLARPAAVARLRVVGVGAGTGIGWACWRREAGRRGRAGRWGEGTQSRRHAGAVGTCRRCQQAKGARAAGPGGAPHSWPAARPIW